MLVRYSVAHHFFCISVLCSAFVLLFMSFNLSAKVYIESDALVYQGEISKQNNLDAFTFYQDASVKPSVLVITSGGGNIDLGMDLGEFVLEHNLDVIKTADYIVDMGPEGGVKGGKIIAEGKPEEICKINESYTGKFLKPLLN